MGILAKGQDFGATEQVTSTKLDNLVDNAKFKNFSETAVAYSGSSGTCLQGGGLEVTTNGQLQLQDGEIDLVKFSTALKDVIHPVGIIVETTAQSTAAAFQTAIGFGTWEAYGSGKVTVAIDAAQTEFDTLQETGGVKEVTLTSAQSGLPAHYHRVFSKGSESTEALTAQNNQNRRFHEGGGHTTSTTTSLTLDGETEFNTAADASSAHTNLQPYIVVYRYRRTA